MTDDAQIAAFKAAWAQADAEGAVDDRVRRGLEAAEGARHNARAACGCDLSVGPNALHIVDDHDGAAGCAETTTEQCEPRLSDHGQDKHCRACGVEHRGETTAATTEDAARALYEEHAWSGCAGSAWENVPDGARAGWEYAAGLLAQPLPETTTEWGVRLPEGDVPVASEDAARRHLRLSSLRRALRREVTAWTEADR